MDLPKRKAIRLKGYDYSLPGAYFITVCVKDRKEILSEIIVWADNVGANSVRPQRVKLTEYGKIVQTAIENIPIRYHGYRVDNYVIMPDHIHLLLRIQADNNGRPMVAPTVDRVIKQTKGYITKQIGFSIWQASFYDHIIRNEKDYKEIWEYIEDNPLK